MILKASERSGAKQLAEHLLKDENEHVDVHELRGFASDDLKEAFQEAYAISRGTRCKNYLFSLSLNPPEGEDVSMEVFEATIERIEQKLGLDGQPRAIVFHEKEGRRHAHAVWSRIDAEEMKAINLPHYKNKLNDIAKELYLEHGWQLPKGFIDRHTRDPLSFTQAEWQQAKRAKQDPRLIKALFQEYWQGSDSAQSFTMALRERGYWLARGDRRGYVALDHRGEVYSLSRMTDTKTKELRARLGNPAKLPSVEETKAWIAERLSDRLKGFVREREAKHRKQGLALDYQRGQMVERHRLARSDLRIKQAERWEAEARERARRLPKGVKGLWGWITGKSKTTRLRNEAETVQAQDRDRRERQVLIRAQLSERRGLQRQIASLRDRHHKAAAELNRDVAQAMMMGGKAPMEITKVFEKEAERTQRLSKDKSRDNGLEFEI